ncbi:MAG: succinylglutamate desuccinylase/aspartoacylase family protein [Deltaproteobacteria bacterium]|nr:succinylglutamate desuccinylase/aspartoacylase family protein [Deltaproteobacteria bacterium]
MGGAEQGGDRVLGTYGGERPGPVLVLVGGIHGNEGAGVRAAERVLAWLATAEVPLRGRVVALVGNAPALAAGARFVDVDLNRGWSPGRVAAARAGELAVATSEDAQQRALLGALDAARRRASEALGFAVLDLHSFSAAGAPFVVTCASERTLAMARAAGLPAITGLERQIPGTFVEFCCGDGAPALGVEGGTHDDPATARQLSAVVVRVLRHLGMVAAEDVDDGGAGAGRAGEGDGPPEVVEIVYRHAIGPDDGFRMRPGYRNLARVREGEELADDARGPVRAPRDGWLVMPLYQGQGDDGFFLGVEREG